MRRVGLPAALVVMAVLWPATPAAAHGADAPSGTNYRTLVTSVVPTMDGLTVRAVEAGGRLELTNRTGRTIEVLGYESEPYLEVRPDGVFANTRSATYYLNMTLGPGAPVPLTADAAAPPTWQRLSSSPVARWHDHRTHWMGSTPPPAVAADPGRAQRIRDWVVPLRETVSTIEVRGTLDWVPPPVAGVWWGLSLVGAVLIGLLGRRWDRWLPLLATLAVAAGMLAVGYAVARELDAGATSVSGVLTGLFRGQVWAVLTGLASIAAAVYALRQRAAGAGVASGGTDLGATGRGGADRRGTERAGAERAGADLGGSASGDGGASDSSASGDGGANDGSASGDGGASDGSASGDGGASDGSATGARDGGATGMHVGGANGGGAVGASGGGAGDLALGLAGACIALISGATNAMIFARSVAPVPFAPVWARVVTALLLTVGAGLALAAGLHIRSVGRTARPS